jgi:DNA-binding LacI/PurR family transcriptional regulator
MRPELVARIERICRETGADVVISSTWREQMPQADLARHLRNNGFSGYIMGVTPPGAGREVFINREREIRAWMKGKEEQIETFVAIDDAPLWTDDFWPHVVLTRALVGITDEDAQKAIDILLPS